MSLYLISLILFVVSLLVFFRLAKRYNIVDTPNYRSSHKDVTIRGGGVIFPISILLFFVSSDFDFPFFTLATLLIATVSFIDDMKPLKTTTRLIFHLVSALLVITELSPMISIGIIPILLFVIIGGINAYNFMDGINGITSANSLVVLGSLYYVNLEIQFVNIDLILLPIIAIFVFSYFNFRKKAKCFSGDVGSLSIALLILFLLLKLIIITSEPLYALFLLVYAIDTSYTMFKRKLRGENIFKPHRSHLYQILVNQTGITHLGVSIIYSCCQAIINYLVIFQIFKSNNSYFWGGVLMVTVLAIYVLIKTKNERKINSSF